MNIKKLDDIRNQIAKAQKDKKTFVTVCGGTGCHAYGCLKVAQSFKDKIKKQKLQDTVSVRTTGCHGFCEKGPIVVILLNGIFYQRVQLKDLDEVIAATIINKKILERLLYLDPKT